MNQRRGNTAPAEAARCNHPLLGCDLKKVTSINKASFVLPALVFLVRLRSDEEGPLPLPCPAHAHDEIRRVPCPCCDHWN